MEAGQTIWNRMLLLRAVEESVKLRKELDNEKLQSMAIWNEKRYHPAAGAAPSA